MKNKNEIIEKVLSRYWEKRDEILTQKNQRYAENREEVSKKRRDGRKNDPDPGKHERAYRKTLKYKCFDSLGGKCEKCGNGDYTVLSVDHIFNDGNEERKTIKSNTKLRNLVVKKGRSGRYQLLCFNCNYKKYLYSRSPVLTGEMKRCPTCTKLVDTSMYKKDLGYRDSYYYECKSCSRRRTIVAKFTAFLRLGSKICMLCGADDLDFLNVDHVHNDGKYDRGTDGSASKLYRKINNGLVDLSRFQVLCFNCNIKKHVTKSMTPIVRPLDFDPDPIDLSGVIFSDLVITSELTSLGSVEHIENHHDAGYGRVDTATFVARHNGSIIGVFKFCPPARHASVSSISSAGFDYDRVLELDRVCTHPDVKDELFKSILTEIERLLKLEFPQVTHVILTSDFGLGEPGQEYYDLGWSRINENSRTYVYIDPDGNRFSKSKVAGMSRADGVSEPDYVESHSLRKSYTLRVTRLAKSI